MEPHTCICLIQERCNDGCIVTDWENPDMYRFMNFATRCTYPPGACICKPTKNQIIRHQDRYKWCLQQTEKEIMETKFSKDSLRRDVSYFVNAFEEIYAELKVARKRLNLYYPEEK